MRGDSHWLVLQDGSSRDYRICSIKRRGYLFHRAILCGFYSRAATNRERRLLNSGFSLKSFVIVRALWKVSFVRLTKNCDAVAWFWSKPFSLISRCFATKRYLHGTSDPFPRFLPMISHDDRLCASKNAELVRISCMLIWYCHSRHEVCSRCACATRILAAASIRERRLFRSARPDVRRQFESGD